MRACVPTCVRGNLFYGNFVRAWELMGTSYVRARENLWELMGTSCVGTYANLWELMGTYENFVRGWELMGTSYVGTYGNSWESHACVVIHVCVFHTTVIGFVISVHTGQKHNAKTQRSTKTQNKNATQHRIRSSKTQHITKNAM